MATDDDTDRYWTRATDWMKSSKPQALATTTSPAQAGLDRSNWISKCARAILSSYRRDDFADPDGYLLQLGMVLERYDDKTIDAVTSPITGIQRSCKYPPSIAEFVEFIEDHIRRSTYASRWDERSKQQLRERGDDEPVRPSRAPPGESYAELFAKHGRPIGPFESGREHAYAPDPSTGGEERKVVAERIKNELREHGFKFAGDKVRHGETPATVKAKYKISDADWDALPDADPGKWQRLTANLARRS